MNRKSVFCLILFLGFSINLYARDSSAGCGIGWEINGDNSFFGTSIRGTTHSTLVPTFSMSFGTSGCAKHSIVKNESRGIHFAESNFAVLMVEMSLGEGEYLAGFTNVMGCDQVEATFRDVMQTNYDRIFSADEVTPVEMYKNVLTQIKSDQTLATNCRKI